MYEELLKEVQTGLAACRSEWQEIADALKDGDPPVSFSFISKVGWGKYTSKPHFQRLEAVAIYLRARKAKKPRQQRNAERRAA